MNYCFAIQQQVLFIPYCSVKACGLESGTYISGVTCLATTAKNVVKLTNVIHVAHQEVL